MIRNPLKNRVDATLVVYVEGYKPQDFSFFHRSEKLVQQDL